MKYKAHIPTEEYGFVEVESDDLVELRDEYAKVWSMFIGKNGGLNQLEWAKFRKAFLMSQGKKQSIEAHAKLNYDQSKTIHQFELTLNDINKDEEI